MGKTLFITAGPEWWGSSRMRAYWPARYMPGTDVIEYQRLENITERYDAVIFQKVFDLRLAADLRANGIRVWWDVCDPGWWWQPDIHREIIELTDGIVASNVNLANDLAYWSGRKVYTIPDRMYLSHFVQRKEHTKTETVRMIWYGVSVNRISLFAAFANLERLVANGHKIELTICDDRPDVPFIQEAAFKVNHDQWTLTHEVERLLEHDIALLPPYPGAWGKVKSNNKMLTAWAAGLPATSGIDYYAMADLVMSHERRQAAADDGYATVCADYRVEQSAAQWMELLHGG
jgi:hypothetical protein